MRLQGFRELCIGVAIAAASFLASAGSSAAQDTTPFQVSWPHNPMVETYTVYSEPEGGGRTQLTVVTAAQCTQGTCMILVPPPTVRTCYPILSMGLFQSVFNEIELCWRPRAPLVGPTSTTGSK